MKIRLTQLQMVARLVDIGSTFKNHVEWGVGAKYHKGDISNFMNTNGNGSITLQPLSGILFPVFDPERYIGVKGAYSSSEIY
jgi:hypothetical protein